MLLYALILLIVVLLLYINVYLCQIYGSGAAFLTQSVELDDGKSVYGFVLFSLAQFLLYLKSS